MLQIRTRATTVVFAIVIAVAACSGTVHAQPKYDPFFDLALRQATGVPSLGDQVATLAQQAAQVIVMKAEFDAQLEAARARFWRSYPGGPDLVSAGSELALLLTRKDQTYLIQFLPYGRPAKTDIAVELLTGGAIDGGILPGAQPAFRKWVEDIRSQLGVKPGQIIPLAAAVQVRDAVNRTNSSYRDYVSRRDMEEFRRAGRTPPGIDPIKWNWLKLLVGTRPWESRCRTCGPLSSSDVVGVDPYDKAEAFRAELEEVLGVDHVGETAARVFDAAERGPVNAPTEYGSYVEPNLYQALSDHLGAGDARRFLIGQIRKSLGPYLHHDWRQARSFYEGFVKQSDEPTVLEIGDELRRATKATERTTTPNDDGVYTILRQPSAVGCANIRVRHCLEERLRKNREAVASDAARRPVTSLTGVAVMNLNGNWVDYRRESSCPIADMTILQTPSTVDITRDARSVVLSLDGSPDANGSTVTMTDRGLLATIRERGAAGQTFTKRVSTYTVKGDQLTIAEYFPPYENLVRTCVLRRAGTGPQQDDGRTRPAAVPSEQPPVAAPVRPRPTR